MTALRLQLADLLAVILDFTFRGLFMHRSKGRNKMHLEKTPFG